MVFLSSVFLGQISTISPLRRTVSVSCWNFDHITIPTLLSTSVLKTANLFQRTSSNLLLIKSTLGGGANVLLHSRASTTLPTAIMPPRSSAYWLTVCLSSIAIGSYSSVFCASKCGLFFSSPCLILLCRLTAISNTIVCFLFF